MTLPKRLIDKLICPNCRQALTYEEEQNRLRCDKCQLTFRVQDDIPVLVSDEADKIE